MKVAKVIPIYKGKGEKYSFTNYRPISLLPVFSKIVEKMIYSKLFDFLVRYQILFKSQYGFRKGRNTSHATIDFCPRRNIIPTRTIIQGGWVSSSSSSLSSSLSLCSFWKMDNFFVLWPICFIFGGLAKISRVTFPRFQPRSIEKAPRLTWFSAYEVDVSCQLTS